MKKIIMIAGFLLLINNYVQADNRFTPPDINAAHIEMQTRLENGGTTLNSDYIRAYVSGLIHNRISDGKENADLYLSDDAQQTERENVENEDVSLIDDAQQIDGNNIINSIIVGPGAKVEGDIIINIPGDGDITLIDNN